MKRILIISKSFYPNISPRSFRTTELTKEFARQGHSVTLLIPKEGYNYDDFENRYNVEIKDLGTLPTFLNDGAKKGFCWIFKRYLRGFAKLIFNYPSIHLTFLVKRAIDKYDSSFDVLISIAAPHTIHWGVALSKKRRKIANIWIADCGDPFMGSSHSNFKKMPYFKYIEKWCFRKVDFITVPVKEAISGYYSEFRKKIHVIPQGFNFDEIKIYDKPIKNKVPTFAYAGTFIKNVREPKLFFEYLSRNLSNYKFIIYTNKNEVVKSLIGDNSINIELRDKVPRKELIYELSKMDFLINFSNKSDVQIPSKLIDYSIAKRPILNIFDENFDNTIFCEFLSAKYDRQFIVLDLERYKIKNIIDKFLTLTELNN